VTAAEVRAFDLFASMAEDDAVDLGARIQVHRADRGSFLFRQGEAALNLVLLMHGQVKMERTAADGAVTIVEILGPGSALAAANFLEREPYPVTAVALADVVYGALSYVDFERCVRTHPDVALALLRYMVRRVHRAYAAMRLPARAGVRLAAALVRIAADAPRRADGLPEVALAHADLAEVAGMARETVTRHLRRWQAQGLVDCGLRSIAVRDLEALRRLAEEA
jgi:CRP-like cAMP-binding protein